MTRLEIQDAVDVINEAVAMSESYGEQFANDLVAQVDFRIMKVGLMIAETAAREILEELDAWDEAVKRIERKEDAELRRLQREHSGV